MPVSPLFLWQLITEISLTTITLSLVTILVVYWYITIPRVKPPGPLGFPIVGSLFNLGVNLHLKLTEYGKQYGPIYSFYMGSRFCVVLNDWPSIKAAFIDEGDVFSGRPLDQMFTPTDRVKYNIVNSEGPLWREHRRFALQSLRDLGFGKLSVEASILDEIRNFLNSLEKMASSKQPININDLLSVSLANNVCIMTMGHRFDYEDKGFRRMRQLVDENISNIFDVMPTFLFPWIRHIPGINKFVGLDKILVNMHEFLDLCEDEVAKHEKTHIDGSREDYIYAYLTEQKRLDRKEGNNNHFFSREALIDNTSTFFSAGSDTSGNTIRWILLYLIKYPEVQAKMQREIDTVIGRDRQPSYYDDRLRTPYVEAVIHEVTRLRPIAPTNVMHSNIKEIIIRGVTIPKRSYIISNIWSVHHDPELWDNPTEFRPERFIQEDGKVHKPEYLIPFSCGKRACPGEGLARMELYLYTISLLQRFTFSAPIGKEATVEADFKFFLFPLQNEIVATVR